MKFFIDLLKRTHTILPTRAKLTQKLQLAELNCLLCNDPCESTHHLILHCPCTMALWRASKWQLRIEAFSHMSILDWIMLLLHLNNCFPVSKEKKLDILHFAVICIEQVWLCRNKRLTGCNTPTLRDTCSTLGLPSPGRKSKQQRSESSIGTLPHWTVWRSILMLLSRLIQQSLELSSGILKALSPMLGLTASLPLPLMLQKLKQHSSIEVGWRTTPPYCYFWRGLN